MYVRTYVYMYVCIYVCVYVCTYVHMYVCITYVCIYVHMYVCTYIFYIYLLACSITLMISNTTCYLHLVFTTIVSSLLFVYFVFGIRFLPC